MLIIILLCLQSYDIFFTYKNFRALLISVDYFFVVILQLIKDLPAFYGFTFSISDF